MKDDKKTPLERVVEQLEKVQWANRGLESSLENILEALQNNRNNRGHVVASQFEWFENYLEHLNTRWETFSNDDNLVALFPDNFNNKEIK